MRYGGRRRLAVVWLCFSGLYCINAAFLNPVIPRYGVVSFLLGMGVLAAIFFMGFPARSTWPSWLVVWAQGYPSLVLLALLIVVGTAVHVSTWPVVMLLSGFTLGRMSGSEILDPGDDSSLR